MKAIQFSVQSLLDTMGPGGPVPVPVGEPVSVVASNAIAADGRPVRSGVWTCTPGSWVRQVRQAEFCHFLAGEARFTFDDGTGPFDISAGMAVYFPANSTGRWDILTPCTKVFILFDEGDAA